MIKYERQNKWKCNGYAVPFVAVKPVTELEKIQF